VSHIYESMFPYQREGALWGRRARNFLLADQPGLGKTIQTLGTIVAAAKRRTNDPSRVSWHLVLCPSVAVMNVWTPEAHRWLGDHKIEVLPLTGSNAARSLALVAFTAAPDTRHVFVVTNIEAARVVPAVNPRNGKRDVFKANNARVRPLFERVWDTIVVDESHRALIRTGGTSAQTRAGLKMLRGERRIALSGTPMRGKPEQLWGTLNWLRPDEYTSYWNWVKKYWTLSSNGFSNFVLGDFQHGGQERLAEDLAGIMLRRTKAEVLPDLPPKTYAGSYIIEDDPQSPLGVWLDPTPAQAKQLATFTEESIVINGDDELIANGVLAHYTRARQLAGAVHRIEGETMTPTLDSPKYAWLLDWLDNSGGEKIVVASQFTSVIDAFAAGLRGAGYDVSVLTGRTGGKARAAICERFQNDPSAQVFMLNTKAGGVSLTLDAADYLVLLDETTIPDEQEQVEDRVHRASRNHNVTIYYLRTRGTIDEEVAYIAAARQDVQQYLLDGARGVEAARAIYLQHREDQQ
jgi:SNF2 family DNA or RNA helicase